LFSTSDARVHPRKGYRLRINGCVHCGGCGHIARWTPEAISVDKIKQMENSGGIVLEDTNHRFD
jgi:hypothetical protein